MKYHRFHNMRVRWVSVCQLDFMCMRLLCASHINTYIFGFDWWLMNEWYLAFRLDKPGKQWKWNRAKGNNVRSDEAHCRTKENGLGMAKTFIAYIHLATRMNKNSLDADVINDILPSNSKQCVCACGHTAHTVYYIATVARDVPMLCFIEIPKTLHRFVQLECWVMRARGKPQISISNWCCRMISTDNSIVDWFAHIYYSICISNQCIDAEWNEMTK